MSRHNRVGARFSRPGIKQKRHTDMASPDTDIAGWKIDNMGTLMGADIAYNVEFIIKRTKQGWTFPEIVVSIKYATQGKSELINNCFEKTQRYLPKV